MGGGLLENKMSFYQGWPGRDQGIGTKAGLAWGGGLENKISFDQGSRGGGALMENTISCYQG